MNERMSRVRIIGMAAMLLFEGPLVAQEDYTWWNTTHDWNGVTPWPDYMKYSAGYMGPNALPVAEVAQGFIDSLARFEVSSRTHWSTGVKQYEEIENVLDRVGRTLLPDFLLFIVIII